MADQQFHQHIDSALALHIEQSNLSLSYWEELKNDCTRRLHASSFIVRNLVAQYFKFELSVECDSPKDLSVWNLGLRAALGDSLFGVFNTSATRVSVQTRNFDTMQDVLCLIAPLVHRTNFLFRKIDSRFAQTAEYSEKPLQQLIECVEKHAKTETNQLTKLCEELKTDRMKRLKFDLFMLKAVEDFTEITQRISYIHEKANVLLWKACTSIALIKLELPENAIRTSQNRQFFELRTTTLRANDIARILDYLQPVADKMSIDIVRLDSVEHKIASVHVDFVALTTKKVGRLIIVPILGHDNLNVWNDIIRKLMPLTVTYIRRGGSHEISKVQLAEIIEKASIDDYPRGNTEGLAKTTLPSSSSKSPPVSRKNGTDEKENQPNGVYPLFTPTRSSPRPSPLSTTPSSQKNTRPPEFMRSASAARQAQLTALNRRHPDRSAQRPHPYLNAPQSNRMNRATSPKLPFPPSSGSSDSGLMEVDDVVVVDDDVIVIGDDASAAAAAHPWLLLENSGNDCFLNAALQYMRRARDLRRALESMEKTEPEDQEDSDKACVLRMLQWFLEEEGTHSSNHFRDALSEVIKLQSDFLNAQQDAYEILTKIFNHLIPVEVERQFHIESVSRKRCRDDENCKGSEMKQTGPIYYQHIERRNQILDLEAALSSDWTAVEGETEPRHCSECCPCCKAKEEGHDEDKCKDCKADRKHYVEETRHTFTGSSNYALVAFNILHADKRVGWALKENCDLNGMKLMGLNWKAVSIIKHTGSASGGHYVTYTREDDGLWWIHDDDRVPTSIGERFVQKSKFPYGEGMTDMKGVVAILFQKCS